MSEIVEEFDGNAESFLNSHNLEFKCEFENFTETELFKIYNKIGQNGLI